MRSQPRPRTAAARLLLAAMFSGLDYSKSRALPSEQSRPENIGARKSLAAAVLGLG